MMKVYYMLFLVKVTQYVHNENLKFGLSHLCGEFGPLDYGAQICRPCAQVWLKMQLNELRYDVRL